MTAPRVLRNVFARYLFAVGAVGLVLGVRMLIVPLTGRGAPFVLFFAATLVASLFAGVGPGLLTIVIGMPLAAFLFVLPAGYTPSQATFQSVLYAIDGLIVVYLTHLARKARRTLQYTEQRTKEVIELAPDAFLLADIDANFRDVNRAACRMFGYERDELVHMTILDLINPEEAPRLAAEKHLLLEGQVVKSEWMLRQRDGTLIPVEVSANIISEGRWQAFVRDISERKRTEDALRHAVAARDQVLGFVAHDLRNPLGTIILQASAFECGGPESEVRGHKTKEIILRAATRMNRLIQDLLDVALVEAAELRVSRERISAESLVRDAVELQRPRASSADVEICLELERAVPEVYADYDRLLEVFENLIGNAIKFTSPGGRITVGMESREAEVLFRVTDTGCGIGPRDLPHVFDRFWTAAARAGRLGAGLGLPITKGIVEAHGGHVWVESTLGRGSTFFFTIPRAHPTADQPSSLVH